MASNWKRGFDEDFEDDAPSGGSETLVRAIIVVAFLVLVLSFFQGGSSSGAVATPTPSPASAASATAFPTPFPIVQTAVPSAFPTAEVSPTAVPVPRKPASSSIASGNTTLSIAASASNNSAGQVESEFAIENTGDEFADAQFAFLVPEYASDPSYVYQGSETPQQVFGNVYSVPVWLQPSQRASVGPFVSSGDLQYGVFDANRLSELSSEPYAQDGSIEDTPYGLQSLQSAIGEMDSSGTTDYDASDATALIGEWSGYYSATSDVAGQLGMSLDDALSCGRDKPLDYSKISQVTISSSADTRRARLSIPLDKNTGNPLVSADGTLRQYTSITVSADECLLKVDMDFSSLSLVSGQLPFDKLEGNLVLYFAKLGRIFKIPIVIEIRRSDYSSGWTGGVPTLTGKGACDQINKMLKVAYSHLGQMPGQFGCPSPACACYSSTVIREAGDTGFAGSALASKVYEESASRGKVMDSYSSLQPGDLVFFQNTYNGPSNPYGITHVEIYFGNGYVIGSGARPVKLQPFSSYYTSRFYRAVRLYECTQD